MQIHELKSKMDFYVDSIYQKGYDLGYESVLEELEQKADKFWNQGFEKESAALLVAIKEIRGTANVENL